MIVDYQYYLEFLSRIKRPVFPITSHSEITASNQSLKSCMSYRFGSDVDGKVLSDVPCSNAMHKGIDVENCLNIGLLACSRCSLVKYCSGRCQRQHWPKHRLDCEHPYLSPQWEPDWILESRQPFLSVTSILPSSSSIDLHKNSGFPAYDCLRLQYNEGSDGLNRNFKICMTAAGDIRNLVETINSLPSGYTGRLDILLNNNNTIVLNRMLVILGVLLHPGPTIEECAELATHLMYSATLPETAASYMRYCASLIYGDYFTDRDMSFQTTVKTRGPGKLYSAQPAASIKRPIEMVSSNYSLSKATESMHETLRDPLRVDDRHKALSMLKPAHRLALHHFWQTGVLAPFSVSLEHFKSPNRLMFTSQGDWIGTTSDINPLHGWDISAVKRSGLRQGIDPAGDILGCLFFHIKSELREFSSRMMELNINIYLVQYDSRLLSKGISIGVLPAFSQASFDRVDLGDMSDQLGVSECLADWGPLLNQNNPKSCLIMHSKRWHAESSNSIARTNPRAMKVLREKCKGIISLKSKLKLIFEDSEGLALARLMATLDAFVDHERAFLEYLENQEAQATGAKLGIDLRQVHSIHSKRVGVPTPSTAQKLPNLSKDEFYDMFVIGGADLTLRFAEFDRAIHFA